MAAENTFKVLILGEPRVGKTSLMCRLTGDGFRPNMPPTLGLDFRLHDDCVDGVGLRLQIWDTAGQERFRTIAETFYKQSDCIVVVFDLSDQESFAKVNYWIESIRAKTDDCLICLCGNKADLAGEPGARLVPAEQIAALAAAAGLTYFPVSAKKNTNVYEAFHFVAAQLLGAQRKAALGAAQRLPPLEKRDPASCCG